MPIFIPFHEHADSRGNLVPIESKRDVPFSIERVYYIWGVPQEERRGGHAHKTLEQVLICLSGSVTILLDDGFTREEIQLNNPCKGLLINRPTWREMYSFAPGTVLLALVSEPYNENDYIRDYKEFSQWIKQGCDR